MISMLYVSLHLSYYVCAYISALSVESYFIFSLDFLFYMWAHSAKASVKLSPQELSIVGSS